MSLDVEDIDPSCERSGDKMHRVVRASLGLLPVGSGTAVEIFNSLITPPIEARRTKWMIEVTEAILHLENEESINSIFESEEFISTLTTASNEALKTHEKEKLNALKAAIVNSALGQAPEFSKRFMFLRYISEFTVWHIKILVLFNDPKKWADKNNKALPKQTTGSRSKLIELMFPELTSDNDFYELLWNDLYVRSLVDVASPIRTMTGDVLLEPCTTESGRNFVKFITESS